MHSLELISIFIVSAAIAGSLTVLRGLHTRRQNRAMEGFLQSLRTSTKSREAPPSSPSSSLAIPLHGTSQIELMDDVEQQIASRLTASSDATKEELRAELARQMEEVRNRLANIEADAEKNGGSDKHSAVNDALLAARIDQLSQQVEGLQKKTLSKWDVATLFSQIVFAIGFIVATTYGVLRFFSTAEGHLPP